MPSDVFLPGALRGIGAALTPTDVPDPALTCNAGDRGIGADRPTLGPGAPSTGYRQRCPGMSDLLRRGGFVVLGSAAATEEETGAHTDNTGNGCHDRGSVA